MQKYKISFTPAFQRVKLKRRFVGPNSGFTQQLRLFYKMGWQIDAHCELYKKFRLHLAADSVRKAKILPQSYMDLVTSDPGLTQTNPEPIVYRCRKCRRVVAARSNVMTHRRSATGGLTVTTKDRQPTEIISIDDVLIDKLNITPHNNSDRSSDDVEEGAVGGTDEAKPQQGRGVDEAPNICTEMYFIEPLTWMDGILRQTQGKLNCPKCHCKLGNFSWIMGCQCPCGVHVSPAFYLVPAKVDLCRSVQNVQMTV